MKNKNCFDENREVLYDKYGMPTEDVRKLGYRDPERDAADEAAA